jgi:hypothetical protein
VPVAELECAVVQATGVAFKTDASAGLAHRVLNFGRRATGGNVTVGTTNSQLVEDSAGSPLLTLTANTTAQTVEVKVTGVASETWHWEVEIQYCVAK